MLLAAPASNRLGATLTAAEWLGVMASLQPAPDLSELVPWLVDGLPANDAADVLAMFPPALAQRYRAIFESWQPVALDLDIAASAARLRASLRLGLADAVQAASALAINAAALVTHDRDFSRLRSLRIIS